MAAFVESRHGIALFASVVVGCVLLWTYPFPGADDPVLLLVGTVKPHIVILLGLTYRLLLFSTPYFLVSSLLSLGYIFGPTASRKRGKLTLPQYPEVASREDLFVVIGEVHGGRDPNASEHPSWLVVPERGLSTGIAVFGAIGSGKTTCVMYPAAEQLFGFRCQDAAQKVAGLVLEVKGDFCGKVQAILEKHGRGEDYVEISLDCDYRYNPLHNDLDAYSVAYNIASLLTSLFGKGREPFWQQAYTNMVKFIVLLHRVVYGYVTLFDVYHCAIDPTLLDRRIKEGEERFGNKKIVAVSVEAYLQHGELSAFRWENEKAKMKAPLTKELEQLLKQKDIAHSVEAIVQEGEDAFQHEQFQAVLRWFRDDWMRIDQRLRTSIVEGISFFLSIFDDNPLLKRIFCPPKEIYQTDGQVDPSLSGRALPPFSDLIERGAVVALNLPAAANPGIARIIGTLMKLDFQRAMLTRIPKIEESRDRGEKTYFRYATLICDEYHMFATAGESDPTGDEKFFALSRQAKCIPIVATQSISSLRSTLPGESWRTLLQTFRTKIFLTCADDFTARIASDLCGRDDHLKLTYNLSESGQDARVNLLTGRTSAEKASVTASKSYSIQRDLVFEPRIFTELKNAQAIVLAYDGFNPIPASYCYLKPYYLDRNISYFEQLERGQL